MKSEISLGLWKKGLITELGWDNEEAIWGKDAAVCCPFVLDSFQMDQRCEL